MCPEPDDVVDPPDPEMEGEDRDTNLILDYLSNKLDRAVAKEIEARASHDKEFRQKLADLVLLKGLVMLALEKGDPVEGSTRECRATRKLFLDYVRGRTNSKKTAALSRHVEECFECDLALERFREHRERGLAEKGAADRAWCRPRRMAVAAAVVVAIAAGAFGVVSLFSSASTARSATVAEHEPPGPGRGEGLIRSPDAVRAARDVLVAADPGLDGDHELSGMVDGALSDATTPDERADLYANLGKKWGRRVEPLLWVIAENEPIERARASAYRAIDVGHADVGSLLAAARREIAVRNDQAFVLLPALADRGTTEAKEYFRGLFANPDDREGEWWARAFQNVYRVLRGDPVIENRMTSYLGNRDDRVRSWAILAASEGGSEAVVPAAIALLDSADAKARMIGVAVLRRHATPEQWKQALARDWSHDPTLKLAVEAAMRAKGIPLTQNP